MKFLSEPRKIWITLTVAILVAVVGLVLAWVLSDTFREWLTVSKVGTESSRTTYSSESGSTTLRNVGLVVAGVFTVGLLIWRARAADKQASAAQRQANIAQQQEEKAQQQVDIAQRQAETAQQGLRNERYQKAVEMLGSEVLSVRLGGIYALQRLAREHPEEYHIQIMRLFCAFAQRPTADKGYEDAIQANLEIESNDVIKGPLARQDVQEVMRVIGKRTENQIALERKQGFWLNLSRASLRHIHLRCANLTGANFSSADLFDASLISVDLTKAWFSGANLSKVNLYEAVLFDSILVQARVSGTIFIGAQGLRQNQLDQARRLDPDEAPPILDEVLDAVSGEQLQWNGGI